MNKSLKSLAVASLLAPASLFAFEGVEVDSFFAFESEYVFRGIKLAGPSIQPGVEISYMGAYAEVWSSSEIFNDVAGPELEVDYIFGYGFDVEDIAVDLGISIYTFPGDDDTYEIYVGAAYTGLEYGLEPALYLFYDFELEDFTVEGSLGYGIDLAEFGLEGFGLDFGGALGYVLADDSDDDYLYYLLSLDLGYAINDAAYAAVGPRLSGNDNDILPDTQFWWGAVVGVAF